MNKQTLLALVCLILAFGGGYYLGVKNGRQKGNDAIEEARKTAIEELRKADSLLIQSLDSLVFYQEALSLAEGRAANSSRRLRELQQRGNGITITVLPVDSLILDLQRIVNTPR